ncbi:MAG: hypothetical protein OEY66_07195 [Gammaproteobacteria bacterium]|nr:hypothetical protein [Gammaproteobacteria bacterium]
MAQTYKTGIILTGSADGAIRAVKLTDEQLKKLNSTEKKGHDTQKKTRAETKKTSQSMGDYAGKLGLVTSAASILTAALGGLSIANTVRETVALTRETNAWAAAVGVTTQELRASEYAAQSLGLSQGKIADIYKDTAEKISDAYINGGGEAVEALRNINLTAADLNSLSPDQQLMAIANGLDSIGDHNNKIQILESLASDASLLIPLLENSGEKFKQLKQEAIDSGRAMSNIDAAVVTLLDVEFRKLSASSDGFGNSLTAGLAPAIYGVTKEINTLTLGWGSASEITAKAIDITVTGLGFVLDAGHDVLTTVKLIEIGWLHVGNVGVSAFIGMGNVGVDFVNNFLLPFRETLGSITEGWGYLLQLAGDFTGNTAWQEAGEFMLGYSKAIKETRFEMADFIGLQKDLQGQIAKSNDELLAMLNAKAPSDEIKKWLAEQRAEVERLAAANVAAAEARKLLTDEEKKAAESSKELRIAADATAQVYKDTASSIRNSFSGAFRDILDDQNTFVDRMFDSIKNLFADIATLQLTKPFIIPFTAGIAASTGANAEEQLAAVSGMGGTAADTKGVMADVGEYIGAGMVGYMAGGMAAKMFDVANPGMAQNLSGIGAMIGLSMGNPFISAIAGFVAGSLFKGDWVTDAEKLNLYYTRGAGVSGNREISQSRDGGAFNSDDSQTIIRTLDAAFTQRLSLTFGQFEDSLVNQLHLLNIGNLNALMDFTSSVALDITGLNSEQVNDVITQWAGNVSVEMAAALLPGLDAFRRVGETGVETIDRLTQSLGLMYSFGRNLDITIASLTAGNNAAAQFGIQIQYATADIVATANQLANTQDMQTRIELEQQYADQVLARYKLEQDMLTALQASVVSISNDISGLRATIGGDIASITGGFAPRSASSIASDLAGISGGSAPDLTRYINLTGKLDTVGAQSTAMLALINEKNSAKNELEIAKADYEIDLQGQIDDLVSKMTSASFDDAVNGSVDRWYAETLSLTAELADGLAEFDAQIAPVAGSISALKLEFAALLDKVTSLQTKADAALTDYNASMLDYLSLTSDQVDQLQSLREETLNYYNTMKQLDGAMTSAAANIGSTLESLRLGTLSPSARLADLTGQFTSLTSSASGATGYDLVSISEQLNALVNPLLSEASTLYASGQGYQDIFNMITSSLGDVQQMLIDGAPQGYEESSITLLTSIDSLLGGLQDVLSAAELAIIDAIDTSRIHTVATLQDIRELLGGEKRTLSSFDVGTSYVPNDMTANIHQGEVIIDPQSSDILRRYGIQVSGGGDSRMVETLNRIERLLSENSGDLRLTVVTADGKVIKEEVIRDIKKRSKRGESIVHAAGVVA